MVARLRSRMERVPRSSTPDTDAANHGCLSYRMGCHPRRPTGFRAVESAAFAQVIKNNRELMAILLGITTFQDIMAGKSVQILTDNVTAMAYIAKKGGPSAELTYIAISIWKLCMDKDILIQIAHIHGIDNVEGRSPFMYSGQLQLETPSGSLPDNRRGVRTPLDQLLRQWTKHQVTPVQLQVLGALHCGHRRLSAAGLGHGDELCKRPFLLNSPYAGHNSSTKSRSDHHRPLVAKPTLVPENVKLDHCYAIPDSE